MRTCHRAQDLGILGGSRRQPVAVFCSAQDPQRFGFGVQGFDGHPQRRAQPSAGKTRKYGSVDRVSASADELIGTFEVERTSTKGAVHGELLANHNQLESLTTEAHPGRSPRYSTVRAGNRKTPHAPGSLECPGALASAATTPMPKHC